MIDYLIIFFIIALVIEGWLILIAGAGMCIDHKCQPLKMSSEEMKTLKAFERFFNNLTEEQQHEYVEKIKDQNYSDSYTPYIRDIWNDSSYPSSNGEAAQNDLQ